MKRTFNLKLNPQELAAAMELFDKEKNGYIKSAEFLVFFFKMGATERARVRLEQYNRQQEENKIREAEAKVKAKADDEKHLYRPDYDYAEEDIDNAHEKIRVAATKFDRQSSGAFDLGAFEVAYMESGQFRELLKRIFNLTLKPKELGAILDEYDFKAKGVNSSEFLKMFLKLGVDEREKGHLAQLAKQRREDEARVEKEKADALALEGKNKRSVDKDFTEKHTESALAKVLVAAVGYDKNHPGAPSLTGFEVKTMNGIDFREILKSAFNIVLTPKELGALVAHVSPEGGGESIVCKDFLTKFTLMGFRERSKRKKESLERQRRENEEQKREREEKVAALVDKADFKMDWNFTSEDFDQAMDLLATAAKKYDKSSPSAPDVSQLDVGTMKPGVFRELLRRTFGIKLTVPQLAAAAKQFDDGKGLINTHNFLIFFTKMGGELRARERKKHDDAQKDYEERVEKAKAKKQRILNQKMELNLEDAQYSATDRTKAFEKLQVVASKYDKNGPGAVPLTAFEAKFLTPIQFKEVLKRTFNMVLSPGELLALMKEFKNKEGNVDCKPFVVRFIQMGVEARQTFKLQQLEKLRKAERLRRDEAALKLKQQEDKMVLHVDFSKSVDEEKTAFEKLTLAAKKYDKSHPGAMSLEAFDCAYMEAATFREMLARIFNVRLTVGELGAVMRFYSFLLSTISFIHSQLLYYCMK